MGNYTQRLLYPDKTGVNVVTALLVLVGGALDEHHPAVIVRVDIAIPIEVFVFMFLGGIERVVVVVAFVSNALEISSRR
jgi:hypothetical protein